MLIISCDPGLTGAMSLMDHNRNLLDCIDLPVCGNGLETGSMKKWIDIEALLRIFAGWSGVHDFPRESVIGCIERPVAAPAMRGAKFGIPTQTTAAQFDTFGVLRTMMHMRCNAVHCVSPSEWKRFYDFGKDKNAARNTCLRLFPTAPVGRVKDHNRAEAILIGNWYAKVKA